MHAPRPIRFALLVAALAALARPQQADDPSTELSALGVELAAAPAGEARAALAADYAARAAALLRALARGGEASAARRRAVAAAALAVLEPIAAALDDPAIAPATRAKVSVELGELQLERGRQGGDAAALHAAESTFARVAAWTGEGEPLALRADLGRGECAAALGEPGRAAALFAEVAERAVPSDPELWRAASAELASAERARRFALLELATPGLVGALAADGRAPEACRAGLRWWRVWRSEAFPLSAPSGENAAAELARVLASAPGVVAWGADARDASWHGDEAAARAAGATTLCGPRDFAALLLSSALDARGSAPLGTRAREIAAELVLADRLAPDAELARRLARAAFGAGDWARAAALFERSEPAAGGANGARAERSAERAWHLGRCAEELGDPLAAAARYREVVERHRSVAPWAARAAEGWYRVITSARGDDETARGLADEIGAATRAARELASGPIAADAAYRDAERLLREKRFDEAERAYAQVPPDAASFELAWAYRALCNYHLGELDAAEAALRELLEVRCADPRHAPADAVRAERRAQARAVGELYYGLIAWSRAEANDAAADWTVVRRRLEPYLARHAGQRAYAPLAASRAVVACLRLGDFAAAELLEGELFGRYPESRWTGAAALEMYRERERLRAETGDPERAARHARAMARELELANHTAPEPAFANLRAESRAWLELGEWARARAVLERIVALFGARERAEVEAWVVPELARAWALEGEPARGVALVEPLLASESPSPALQRLQARLLGGWCELDGASEPREIAGVGDAASFARALELHAGLLARETRFEAGWYAVRFDALYARWRYGALDPRQHEAARRELRGLQEELGERFERLAAPELARRLCWLGERLR